MTVVTNSPASTVRIGTWNMAGRGAVSQTKFLLAQRCDVLLLTEVPNDWTLPGYHLTRNTELMQPTKRWAAVASTAPLLELQPTHPASAAAIVDGVTYVSSILPWRSCGNAHPWKGSTTGERATNAIDALAPFLRAQPRLVWGGDWNQPFHDPDYLGSRDGRKALERLTTALGLHIATRDLPHQKAGITAIDHIAVAGRARRAERIVAAAAGRALSDHDLYVVEV